ncbi:HAD-IA family hydrolase [Pseudonocardia acaciae]|uniref:HAD-IA family hydrolase n=1 Tax=Pseudonocardia acaciae TaxID=551276 RepID=UPI0009FEA25C|nr:HAD-IA family hydrolase [Pseudonocardia acaciae]
MTNLAIFDLDGTLVDTPTGIVRSFAATLTELGLPVPPDESIRATVGTPLASAFAHLLGLGPDDPLVARAVAGYHVAFRELVLPKAADLVFPGVVDGLAALERDGFALAVATSKFRANADALLGAAGLRDRFHLVVGADEVHNPKPAPDIGLLVLHRLRAPASTAVMVGDTTHDLRMAAAAGVRSIAVGYGVHPRAELESAAPTWLADTFDEVVELLLAGRHTPAPDGVVARLLDDRSYHIEFNGHLTNHAKHAVVALAGLGRPAHRIEDFYRGYAQLTPYGFGLEPPKPDRHEITESNWTRFLGGRTAYGAYCEFFDRRIHELGLAEVLRRYVPTLLAGWVGAFTHATIHLGWGLDAGSRWMTVEGLAYLAFSYDSCHPERVTTDDTADATAVDSLLRIAGEWDQRREELRAWALRVTGDTSAGALAGVHPELLRSGLQFRIARMQAEGHPLIYRAPAWLDRHPAESWPELHHAATLLYLAAPGDFVLLHLITSLYAMERIADHLPLDAQREAVRDYWVGMLCIVFSGADLPARRKLAALHTAFDGAVDDPGEHTDRDWRHIVARAAEEDEEHNPKLVYVLRRVWERTGRRSIFRAAAAQFTATPELPPSFEQPPNE